MEFGKVITHESYFNGQLKSTKVEYSIPELIKDKSEALSAVMKCLDLISTKQTHHLTITVEADKATHNFKLVTRSYITEK
jgi:hypothetical protein